MKPEIYLNLGFLKGWAEATQQPEAIMQAIAEVIGALCSLPDTQTLRSPETAPEAPPERNEVAQPPRRECSLPALPEVVITPVIIAEPEQKKTQQTPNPYNPNGKRGRREWTAEQRAKQSERAKRMQAEKKAKKVAEQKPAPQAPLKKETEHHGWAQWQREKLIQMRKSRMAWRLIAQAIGKEPDECEEEYERLKHFERDEPDTPEPSPVKARKAPAFDFSADNIEPGDGQRRAWM